MMEWIAVAVAGCSLVGATAILINRIRTQSREIHGMARRIEHLDSVLKALCSGAVGVDKRVNRLERSGRDLEHRQTTIESQQQDEFHYGEAIQMVHKGAQAKHLQKEFGLNRGEADLLVMLHGAKRAS